ncbi:hypothetical protein K9847_09815 [Latilactobacillus curvatus]|nr:hypothetical protein [Latilactobacillus curvatus]MCP8848836.1 hypothetical protein [Latilactobacillus curvatus]
MYPFFSLYLFIWPLLLPIKLRLKVFIFALLFNICASANIFGFIGEFTNNLWIKSSIAVLYLFNNYHLVLSYKRFALGELLGYTMFPLVAWGIVKIWKRQKVGILLLALGVSLIANSHILSLLFLIVVLILAEIVRLLMQKFNWEEARYICIAAALTIPMSAVTIYNFLVLSMHNRYLAPNISAPLNESSIFPQTYIVDLKHTLHPLALTDLNARTWNIGTLFLILAFIAIIYLIVRRKDNDGYYAFVGIIGLLLVIGGFDFVNWDFTEHLKIFEPIKVIQFLGRLLMLAAIFLVVPVMRMMIKVKALWAKWLISVPIIIFLINGMMTIYRTQNFYQEIVPTNILESGYNNQLHTIDYFPAFSGPKSGVDYAVKAAYSDIKGPIMFGNSVPSFNSATYHMRIKHVVMNKYLVTPVAAYNRFNYRVTIDGQTVKWIHNQTYGTIAISSNELVNKKKAKLCVVAKPLKNEWLVMIIAGIANMAVMLRLILDFKRK